MRGNNSYQKNRQSGQNPSLFQPRADNHSPTAKSNPNVKAEENAYIASLNAKFGGPK